MLPLSTSIIIKVVSTTLTLSPFAPPAQSQAYPVAAERHSLTGGAQPGETPPPVRITPGKPIVQGSRAKLIRGIAYAPSQAPEAVRRVIWAGNHIRNLPYSWGGGHGSWAASGYDCSGSVSYALHGGGLLRSPQDSSGLASWGTRGRGHWITVYANGGHAYMIVAGLRFDTSGARPNRWQRNLRAWGDAYSLRHPRGL